MKKLYLIIFVICCIFIVNSCKDSLGIDPNVVITSITKDSTGTSHIPPVTAYQVDSIKWGNFSESAFIHNDQRHRDEKTPFPWPCSLVTKSIKIDTNATKPFISLDLAFNGPLLDPPIIDRRIDRIVSFHLIFSSEIFPDQLYQLNSDSSHKEFLSIILKRFAIMDKEYDYYNSDASHPKNINAQLNILEYDKNKGILSIKLDIIIPDPFRYDYQTCGLSGRLDIFFKK